MMFCQDVCYRYPGNQEFALDGVSLSLARGSFHFLTGPSGAGKTTLFRMLYLDLIPTTGDFRLFNQDVRHLSREQIAACRRKMGIVFQNDRLLDNLTVQENVELPLSLQGPIRADQAKAVQEILAWVGLQDKMSALPARLSGGERQRAAIARAVVNRPHILLADEPTGNLDDHMGQKIMHLFCELHRHGTTVLVATHNTDLVDYFGFPCLYMQAGQLIGRTPSKRQQSPAHNASNQPHSNATPAEVAVA